MRQRAQFMKQKSSVTGLLKKVYTMSKIDHLINTAVMNDLALAANPNSCCVLTDCGHDREQLLRKT